MDLTTLRFPRQLEADGTEEKVRRALTARTERLWSGGVSEVPVLSLGKSLGEALQRARMRGRIRCGFEVASDRMAQEKKGIARVRAEGDTSYGDRVSRLLLCSSDGAERLYRHIDVLLAAHAPRLLVCRLDADAVALGGLIAGRGVRIKVVLVEHKDDCTAALQAIAADAWIPEKAS